MRGLLANGSVVKLVGRLIENHRKLVIGKITQCKLKYDFVISSLDGICPFPRGDLNCILKIPKSTRGILAHACNVSTQEAVAGGFSWLEDTSTI